MTTLIDSCPVAPPAGSVSEQSLPLTFFDIAWLHFHPIRRLLFYEIPACSKPYFLEDLLPKLKHSLSLTLKHYFPLAGNLVYPLELDTEEKPTIRYLVGDSIPFTVFESTNDFDDLVGNHPRDAGQFYDYIPQLRPITREPNRKLLRVLALRVTLFPGRGICIGIANHHAVGDAASIVGFVRAWASIAKLGGEDEYLTTHGHEALPLFHRSPREDLVALDSLYWNEMKGIPFELPSLPVLTERVRATHVLNQSDIKNLKDSIVANVQGFAHPSSFVVMSAYVWTCLAKSLVADGEVDIDQVEFFLFAVDGRPRLDPPLPVNYFGNCLGCGLGKVRREDLVGPEGFFTAAKAIADEIKNSVNNKEGFMKRAENGIEELGSLFENSVFSVSGSARVDLYGADFGWGKARKMETLSIDGDKYAMSVCKSRDCEAGGLEIGLSLPKLSMDAFAAVFTRGLSHAN